MLGNESADELAEDEVDAEFDDFLKQGGLDVEEMQAPKVQETPKKNGLLAATNGQLDGKDGANTNEEEEKLAKEDRDTEPDESMAGYLLR